MFATYNESQILVMNIKLVVEKIISLLQITIKPIRSTFASSIILQTPHTKPPSCQKDAVEKKQQNNIDDDRIMGDAPD